MLDMGTIVVLRTEETLAAMTNTTPEQSVTLKYKYLSFLYVKLFFLEVPSSI